MTQFRVLGVAHILVGLLLLPLSVVFGLLLAPLLVLLPLWVVILGVLVWLSGLRARVLVRRTHLAAIPLAALLCVYGVLALQAAGRSAAEGGGLLGAYGLIPLVYALLLGMLSIASLAMTRSREG